MDNDGDVDQGDYYVWAQCSELSGPAILLPVPFPPELSFCPRADFDRDGDIDMSDFGQLQVSFTGCYGAGCPAPPCCGPNPCE